MITTAQWSADHLQNVLYRLLVHKEAPREPISDDREENGHFETELIVDPFGALFGAMTGKQVLDASAEKNKPFSDGNKRR